VTFPEPPFIDIDVRERASDSQLSAVPEAAVVVVTGVMVTGVAAPRCCQKTNETEKGRPTPGAGAREGVCPPGLDR